MSRTKASSRKAILKMDRQATIAKFIRKNPYLSNAELGKILGVAKATISKDIREIKMNVVKMTVDDFRFHQNRVLREIQEMKKLCQRKLKSLAKQPTAGARWVEEFTKLVEKESKILGLYAPEMRVLAIADLTKDVIGPVERDAAIDAIMFGKNSGIIDVTPITTAKQITS